uniref:P3a n=1 Tax=Maize yellow mosaic virus TaxID=1856642 RepID=A0A1W6IZY1_9VIRU|nr:protein 3a [Maize yellow mosaic virus]ARM59484.1 protein 3a [Maize yellow mosaic virus]ARM59488.1 protein 3a [Maize yellow mosaic virus]ARM59492.1 protein 3a [Maize yellow mosaic virus]ARM59496.1 protein 3a [Maize yellow mosaic virus]
MDWKLFCGVLIGILVAVPVTIFGLYKIYLSISSNVRSIVNEYGR